MFLNVNHYLAVRLADMRAEEALHRAEIRRLIREAGIVDRGWWSRQRCWLLCQLGRLLVAVGRRLKQYGAAGALSLEGKAVGGK
jgi:hypothetical protein